MANLKSEMFQKLTKNEESLIFGGKKPECGDTKTEKTKYTSNTGERKKDVDNYEYVCRYIISTGEISSSWEYTGREYR